MTCKIIKWTIFCFCSDLSTCENRWAFDLYPASHLENPNHSRQIQLNVDSFHQCLDRCWLHQPQLDVQFRQAKWIRYQSNNRSKELGLGSAEMQPNFHCRSVNYDPKSGLCTLNQHNRRALPEAFRHLPVHGSSLSEMSIYADNHCVKCE